MGIVSPGPAGPPSWADNRSQTHPDVGLLASPSHYHPYSILPLKSYQGFNLGPLMPFLLQPPTPAQEPPRGLLTASFSLSCLFIFPKHHLQLISARFPLMGEFPGPELNSSGWVSWSPFPLMVVHPL